MTARRAVLVDTIPRQPDRRTARPRFPRGRETRAETMGPGSIGMCSGSYYGRGAPIPLARAPSWASHILLRAHRRLRWWQAVSLLTQRQPTSACHCQQCQSVTGFVVEARRRFRLGVIWGTRLATGKGRACDESAMTCDKGGQSIQPRTSCADAQWDPRWAAVSDRPAADGMVTVDIYRMVGSWELARSCRSTATNSRWTLDSPQISWRHWPIRTRKGYLMALPTSWIPIRSSYHY